MAHALGWLLLMLLLVAAGPAVGLVVGLAVAAGLVAAGEFVQGARDAAARRLEAITMAVGAGRAAAGRPGGALPAGTSAAGPIVPPHLGGPPVRPGRINLPTELRARRCRLFQVEACDAAGRARVLTVDALHPAAAEQKVWSWGLQVRRVDPAATSTA